MRFKARLQLIGSALISGFFLGVFYSGFILLIILVARGLNKFLQFFFQLDLTSKAQLAGWGGRILTLIPFVVATALITALMIELQRRLIPK